MTTEKREEVIEWIKKSWTKVNTVWVYYIVKKELGINRNEFYSVLKETGLGKEKGRKARYRLKICTAQVLKGKFGEFHRAGSVRPEESDSNNGV